MRLVPEEVKRNPQEYEELPLDEQKDVTPRVESLVLLEEGVCYDQCVLLAKLY